MAENENLVGFTDSELNTIIDYMEEIGVETIQEAVIHAITKMQSITQFLKERTKTDY